MKHSWSKIIFGAAAVSFLFAIFCFSFCRLAKAGHCSAQQRSCPMAGQCPESSFSRILQTEEFKFSFSDGVSQFSNSKFFPQEKAVREVLISLPQALYESPPFFLQRSVPTYLFNRVLRL